MTSQTPDWVKSSVFYQIFPDRFAKSDRIHKPNSLVAWGSTPDFRSFQGGDLLGVVEKLDYLQDLGVNAIYLNPIFQSTAYHRYHTHDYFQVDPILGGNSSLRTLIDELHKRNMRILLDGVFNHASRSFLYFAHTLENGLESPYIDWFHFNKDWIRSGHPLDPYGILCRHFPSEGDSFQVHGYAAWWGMPALPKFNTQNPEVREFIFKVAEFWLEFGIDGWRLDVPNEIDDDNFWREFRTRCRKINPQSYICGEIWTDAHRWLEGDQFDAVMNYPLTRAILGTMLSESLNDEQVAKCGYESIERLQVEDYARVSYDLFSSFDPEIAHSQFNLLGSHDTPRILSLGQGDLSGVKLAYLALFSFPGSPCIYYADEIGMAGEHDPDCRRAFDWDPKTWNQDLRNFIKDCAHAKRSYQALQFGDLSYLHAQDKQLVLLRSHEQERVVVCFNLDHLARQIEFKLTHSLKKAKPLLSASEASFQASGLSATVKLAARSAQAWLLEE